MAKGEAGQRMMVRQPPSTQWTGIWTNSGRWWEDRGAWCTVLGVAKSRTQLSAWTATRKPCCLCRILQTTFTCADLLRFSLKKKMVYSSPPSPCSSLEKFTACSDLSLYPSKDSNYDVYLDRCITTAFPRILHFIIISLCLKRKIPLTSHSPI